MGRFSSDWLALREPADHASINAQVRRQLRTHFTDAKDIKIVDLGCGTGSNLRSLAADLPESQSWTLVDYDKQTLEIASKSATSLASTSAPGLSMQTHLTDLSHGGIADLIHDTDLVTAAAFFDLVSQTIIERMVDDVAAAGCVFSTTLIYDGIAAWLPQHPLDSQLRDAFNAHQRTDKGFGAAAGPDASDILAAAFKKHHYKVLRGASPWVLTSQFAELRGQTDAGWLAAAKETDDICKHDLEDWSRFREAQSSKVTIVGHQDILALPPSRG